MNEPDLNIGKIIRLILMQSKFVLSVALLFLGLLLHITFTQIEHMSLKALYSLIQTKAPLRKTF